MRRQKPESRPVVFVILAVLVGGFASAQAQDDESPSSDSNKEVAAERSASGGAEEVWERLIYLPFRDLKKVFDSQSASVIMPYIEYLRLWHEQSERGPAQGQPPRVDAVMTRSRYAIAIDGETARIQADFTVRVVGKPWVEIPIAFGRAAVGRVTSENESVLLRGTGDGTYSLLIGESGEHEVGIELLARVHTAPEGRSIEFDCPSVGITQLELTIPIADQDVVITPAAVQQNVEAENVTRLTANLGSTKRISARWNPRVSTKPQMELLTSVTNLSQVTIDEGLIHTAARLHFDVLRGETEQLRISVPRGVRILDVAAPQSRIRGWRAAEHKDRQEITVDLLSATSDRILIEVHTERALKDGPVEALGVSAEGVVYGIHAVDVVRESGQLAVSHGESLTVNVEQQQGLARVTGADIDESLRRPNSFFYRFYSPAVRLQLNARPAESRITVNHTSQFVFRNDELRLRAALGYSVEKAGIFELALRIPEGLTIDSVVADGMSEFKTSAAGDTLTIALAEKRMGAIGVSVRAHLARDADQQQSLVLPVLVPLNVERETGRIEIHAPSTIEVIADEEQLEGATPEHEAAAGTVSGVRLASLWSYTRRPVVVAVRTVRRPTRLTATVGTRVDVQRELVRVETRIAWNVENAGIDTFRFSVPEAVSGTMQIETVAEGAAAAIKQKSAGGEARDGWVTWTVITQTDVVGRQVFRVAYDLKAEGDIESGPATFDLEPLQVLDPEDADGDADSRVTLARIIGEIVILKDRALSISAQATGEDVELIDIRELRTLAQDGYLAYHYFRQPVSLAVTAEKHEIQEIVQTVVSRSLVEIVLTRDFVAAYLCRYRLTSSERQRLRIDLPVGVELHDPLLNGTRTQLAPDADSDAPNGWRSYTLSVARTASSEETFSLTLHFRAPVTQPDTNPFDTEDKLGGVHALRVPVIGGANESAVVVQQLRTVVWVPEDFALVGAPDGFDRDSQIELAGFLPFRRHARIDTNDLDQWIGGTSVGIVDFPRDGRAFRYSKLGGAGQFDVTWWHVPGLVWVLSGATFLIGFLLRKTSWENRLTMVLLAAFAVGIFAVRDDNADVVSCGIAASSYGLAAVAALWILRGVFGRRRAPDERSSRTDAGAGQPPPTDSNDTTGAAVTEPEAGEGPAVPAAEKDASPPGPVAPPPGSSDMNDDITGRKDG